MKSRFILLLIIFSVIIIYWILHLFAVQVVDLYDLRYRSEGRYIPGKEILYPYRGSIFDRNGKMMVSSLKYYQIDIDRLSIDKFCNRNIDRDVNKMYDKAAEIISEHSSISKKTILRKLRSKTKSNSIFITKKIKESQLVEIISEFRNSKIPGLIHNFDSMKRTYAYGQLAARVLGMVKEKYVKEEIGVNNSIYKMNGVCGIESSFDEKLSGNYGWKKILFDGNNRKIPNPQLAEKREVNGESLILTIDIEMQEILENNLTEGLKNYEAKKAYGIIMDPNTGEILAMSSMSDKDKLLSESQLRSLPNMVVSQDFEPGSTIKPVTSLLALEKKLYKSSDKINCRTYRLKNRTIKDAHEFKSLSFKDILVHSSNVGISKVAEKVGGLALYNRLHQLGFGHKTGSNLASESTGIFRKFNKWNSFSLHSISFGQEISATTLQLANAYCTLANGGKVMKPTILKEIKNYKGESVSQFEPIIIREISNKLALDTLKVYLQEVVDSGTAIATKLDYIKVAGKTGTAEKKDKDGKGYGEFSYISVFAGFYPVENPQIVTVIAFDEPDYRYHYASMSAVPTFKKIAEEILILPTCNILPEVRREQQVVIKMPNILGLSEEKAVSVLNENKIQFTVMHNNKSGIVVNQYPKADVDFDIENKVILVIGSDEKETENFEENDFKMPNLIGLTLRKGLNRSRKKNISILAEGRGIIVSQSIAPGLKVKLGEKCKVVAQ